ncbi:GNAT family N-acetyltransferase [Nocardia sp. NPDC004654]|uniref:GNAT family N-acetyltransferase n=1 Tax=Nocardia sp. NPDC004654 TaxID=3154776 RepID=UPI0033A12C74
MSLRHYCSDDAAGLFEALRHELAWEHIPRRIPRDVNELTADMQPTAAASPRMTFTVRQWGEIVGRTSIIYDPSAPAGVEIGATQFDPSVWGTGVNTRVKRLLVRELFDRGAEWIQFRTDERNGRSAAAIRKLGATELGVRPDHFVRRDGTQRRSRFFRLEPPTT